MPGSSGPTWFPAGLYGHRRTFYAAAWDAPGPESDLAILSIYADVRRVGQCRQMFICRRGFLQFRLPILCVGISVNFRESDEAAGIRRFIVRVIA